MYGSLNFLWHCPSLGLECKLIFSSPEATAEFSKFAGILSVSLYQHRLLGFEISQLESCLHSIRKNTFLGFIISSYEDGATIRILYDHNLSFHPETYNKPCCLPLCRNSLSSRFFKQDFLLIQLFFSSYWKYWTPAK